MKKRLLRFANVLLLPLLFLLLMAVSLNGRAQELSINKLDYAPGETVQITGTGWASGEVVTLKVDHLTDPIPDHGTPDPHVSWTATADAGGTFTSTWYVSDFELGAELRLVAIGISGYTYEIFFTDGNIDFSTSGLPVGANISISVNYTEPGGGSDGTATSTTFILYTPGPAPSPRIGAKKKYNLNLYLSLKCYIWRLYL